MLNRYEEEIINEFVRDRAKMDIYAQVEELAVMVMGVTSESPRAVLRNNGAELTLAINEMCRFLLDWKDPDAGKLLNQILNSISNIYLRDGHKTTSFFGLDVMIKWASSDHAPLIEDELSTYHENIDFQQWGRELPRLFIETSVNVERYFFDNHLAIRMGSQLVPYAVSAVIQHLRFGLDFPESEVFAALHHEAFRNEIAPHAVWIQENFAKNGYGDRNRATAFFELYSQQMTELNKTNGAGKFNLAKNLDHMCSDRTLTWNDYSKRVFLSDDMGLSL